HLASYIVRSQPRIRTMLDGWRLSGNKETFLSQLQKNQEVKNIVWSETPWLLEATTEAEQQARLGTLFDLNRLSGDRMTALTQLKNLQDTEGAWSWYKGMPGNRSLTTYITELLVRIPLMTKEAVPAELLDMQQSAFGYLHQEASKEYDRMREIEKKGGKNLVPSGEITTYLYLTALSGEKVPAAHAAAYRYFLEKVRLNLPAGTMACKAQSAIILQKAGRTAEAKAFIASLKEHLVQTEETGASFAFLDRPYNWGMMPVPTQVDAMEALLLVEGDTPLVEEMKLWLLKQKQTQSWNSPVATADAVYALLCQGSDLLQNRGDVRITLGKKVLETPAPARTTVPGLGYLKETFTQGSPELRATSVTVEKRDAGIAWGAVYAQYLSPLADVKQQGNGLEVEKNLYVERTLAGGQVQRQPVTATTRLAVGDKVVSCLTLRVSRAMDFVQLQDRRGACFEPTVSLSGYSWDNGLNYYREVEDASTNFFFDRLGKGVYLVEHSDRVTRTGVYEAGLATLQCAYAAEFAAHSSSMTVTVK
ncbi:MAG: alpha-2-macroglobulin, partial [Bacteroides sp.]